MYDRQSVTLVTTTGLSHTMLKRVKHPINWKFLLQKVEKTFGFQWLKV
jgi:hypothetical protein